MAGVTTYYKTGVHGSRPANGSGCVLYSCTTHNLVYRDDGTSWTTFITLPGAGLSDPMTTRGDIIVRDSSNATARLGRGSADTYLGSDGTDVAFSAVTDAKLSTSDITTNNASTSKHGFLKKLSNVSTEYMSGTGVFSTPASGGITRTTLGTTSAGASFRTARGIYLKKVTLATDGLIQSIAAFVKGDGSNYCSLFAGIYADSSGSPTNVIAACGTGLDNGAVPNLVMVLSTTVRAITIPIGYWAVAGDYWLAVQMQAGADSRIQLAYTASGASDKYQAGSAFADVSTTATSGSTTDDGSFFANILR